jgi:hypothetical protein
VAAANQRARHDARAVERANVGGHTSAWRGSGALARMGFIGRQHSLGGKRDRNRSLGLPHGYMRAGKRGRAGVLQAGPQMRENREKER